MSPGAYLLLSVYLAGAVCARLVIEMGNASVPPEERISALGRTLLPFLWVIVLPLVLISIAIDDDP